MRQICSVGETEIKLLSKTDGKINFEQQNGFLEALLAASDSTNSLQQEDLQEFSKDDIQPGQAMLLSMLSQNAPNVAIQIPMTMQGRVEVKQISNGLPPPKVKTIFNGFENLNIMGNSAINEAKVTNESKAINQAISESTNKAMLDFGNIEQKNFQANIMEQLSTTIPDESIGPEIKKVYEASDIVVNKPNNVTYTQNVEPSYTNVKISDVDLVNIQMQMPKNIKKVIPDYITTSEENIKQSIAIKQFLKPVIVPQKINVDLFGAKIISLERNVIASQEINTDGINMLQFNVEPEVAKSVAQELSTNIVEPQNDFANVILVEKDIKKSEDTLSLPLTQSDIIGKNNQLQNVTKDASIKDIKSTFEPIPNQIAQKLLMVTKEGTKEINIVLKPEKLGEINLKVVSDKDGIRAHIVTSNIHVKNEIDNQSIVLSDLLKEQGFKLNTIEVHYKPNAEGYNQFQGRERHQQNQQQSNNFKSYTQKQYANKFVEALDSNIIIQDVGLNYLA